MTSPSTEPLMQSNDHAPIPQSDVERGQKTDSYLVAMSGQRPAPGAVPMTQLPKTAEDAEPLATADRVPVVYGKNNDRPVEFEMVREPPVQIGLTKEELEQYRNDPFWKKLRMFLFVLFWLLWILMFLGAILIVILTPKCPPKHEPKWWENQVCYQAWVPSFQDSEEKADGLGDLNGMSERLNRLRKLGLSSVWATPLLSSLNGNGVEITDHKKIEPRYGNNGDFAKMVDLSHSLHMKTIIDFPLTTTSVTHPWFLQSVNKTAGYENSYVWGRSSNRQYWSHENVSRAENFLHLKGKKSTPITNLDDEKTFARLMEVMKFYLDEPYNVDGFHIPNIEYAARNAAGDRPNWEKISEHMKKVRLFVNDYRNKTDSMDREIVIFATVEGNEAAHAKLVSNESLNYIINRNLRSQIDRCDHDLFDCLYEVLLSDDVPLVDDGSTPRVLWQLGSPFESRLATQLDSRNRSEMLQILQVMLPGASLYYYGDPLGMIDIPSDVAVGEGWPRHRAAMQWSGEETNGGFSSIAKPKAPISPDYKEINFDKQYAEPSSPVKVFRKLASLRLRDETLMLGDFVLGDKVNNQVLTFGRYQKQNRTIKAGTEIYVGALNFGADDVEVTVTFSKEILPTNDEGRAKGEIVTGTSTVDGELYWPRKKVNIVEEPLKLYGGQGLVVKFKHVPEEE